MALRPVRVLNATDDGVISGSNVNIAQAVAYFNSTAQEGEIGVFRWGSSKLEKGYQPGTSLGWVITLNTAFPPAQVLSDGVYVTTFEVEDIAGNIEVSPPVTITVENSPVSSPSLLAPTLPGNPNSIINKATSDAGFNVDIPAQSADVAGATFTLYLRLIQLNGTFIALHDIGSGTLATSATSISVAPSAPFLQGLDGVNGFFYYVASGSYSGTSFTKQAYIDTVPPGSL